MSHPELSLPATSVRDLLLEFSRLVIREHTTFITPWSGTGALTYQWKSIPEAGFTPPIALDRTIVTNNPIYDAGATVVETVIQVIDTDDLKSVDMSVAASRKDKTTGTMNNDPWAAMILDIVSKSYAAHNHEACQAAAEQQIKTIESDAMKRRSPTYQNLKINDKRHGR